MWHTVTSAPALLVHPLVGIILDVIKGNQELVRVLTTDLAEWGIKLSHSWFSTEKAIQMKTVGGGGTNASLVKATGRSNNTITLMSSFAHNQGGVIKTAVTTSDKIDAAF